MVNADNILLWSFLITPSFWEWVAHQCCRVVFETDTLPLHLGEYPSTEEAYDAAIMKVKAFRDCGLPSLYKFRVEPYD